MLSATNQNGAYPAVQPVAPPPTGPHNMPTQRPYALILALIVVALLLIGSLIFGYWSYSQMRDYKFNSDKITAAAVEKALAEQKVKLQAEYDEREKSPVKTYTSPSEFGSVSVQYPKTWSAYVVEHMESGGTAVDGYFYPNFVPGINTSQTNYSLRMQIMDANYKTVTERYKSQISQGKIKAVPFVASQVKNATAGLRLDGEIEQGKQGAMVIVPLRDKVLKIWNETALGVNDLNNFVLKNLTYSP